MSETKIEWADYTFNPWSGCAKVSAGCAHCYAAALPPRMRRGAVWGPTAPRQLAADSYWAQPRAWNRAAAWDGRRRRVFCASTADVFEDRPELDPWRERLWMLIGDTPELDWLLLTKRPARMALWAREHGWPDNAWAGASVEDQAAADARLPHLLAVPARVRFVSCEPLLGPVDFAAMSTDPPGSGFAIMDGLGLVDGEGPPGIHWIIAGGESGSRARPMHPAWVRSLRDQAAAAGVPFLFKQWGEWADADDAYRGGKVDLRAFEDDPNDGGVPQHRFDDGTVVFHVSKTAAGRLLDGREHLAFPAPCRDSRR